MFNLYVDAIDLVDDRIFSIVIDFAIRLATMDGEGPVRHTRQSRSNGEFIYSSVNEESQIAICDVFSLNRPDSKSQLALQRLVSLFQIIWPAGSEEQLFWILDERIFKILWEDKIYKFCLVESLNDGQLTAETSKASDKYYTFVQLNQRLANMNEQISRYVSACSPDNSSKN